MTFSCSQDDLNELYDMLSTCRPYNSAADHLFVKEFLSPLGVKLDEFGNAILKIGDLPIIWSCHTDTVHRVGGLQKIVRDEKYNLKLSSKSTSGCLGADDTAGVWLMSQMIKAKRPGIYIFHRGEECGGKGSDWLTEKTPEVAKDVKAVIALDRKGTGSVITFQSGGRCCSEEFSESMGKILHEAYEGLDFKSDRGGSFTDSANYTDIVGECTNLSVGYYDQHTSRETLNLPHLVSMREALIKADFSKLVFHRQPGEVEHKYGNNTGWHYDADNYGQYENGTYYDRSRYSNSAKIYNQAEGFYEKEFRGGYWEGMRWVTCNKIAWEAWCVKKQEERKLKTKEKDKHPKGKNKPITTTISATKDTKEVNTDINGNVMVPVCTALVPVLDPLTETVKVTPITQVEEAFDLELLMVIRSNTIAMTRMMADWGFDAAAMTSMLDDYKSPSAKGAALPKATVIVADAKELPAGK